MKTCIWKYLLKIRDSHIYWLIQKLRNSELYITGEVLIDGYPRSGNSYAAFIGSQIGMENFIHHTHSPYILRKAVKANKTAIILIRTPLDCISSYILRNGVSVERSVIEYCNFYETALRYRDKIHLWRFDEMIRGRCPIVMSPSGQIEKEIMIRASARLALNEEKNSHSPITAALPSVEKDKAKQLLFIEIQKHELFEKCKRLFDTLINED
jgi:hypothetical protein